MADLDENTWIRNTSKVRSKRQSRLTVEEVSVEVLKGQTAYINDKISNVLNKVEDI